MRLLLDSHALLWAVADDPRLSDKARALILDGDNDVFYSPVNLYEILFRASRGRISADAAHLLGALPASGFEEIGLASRHLIHAARLDWDHGDPWDRILLAQANLEDMGLISADKVFDMRTDRRSW